MGAENANFNAESKSVYKKQKVTVRRNFCTSFQRIRNQHPILCLDAQSLKKMLNRMRDFDKL
jgi:hypothetical protein